MTEKSRTLTAKQLKKAGACSEQYKLFVKTFGKSVIVTEELAVAHADKFNFTWAVGNLLTQGAQAEYQRVTDAAWAVFILPMAKKERLNENTKFHSRQSPWRNTMTHQIPPTITLGEIGNGTPAARQVDAAVRSAGVVNRPSAEVYDLAAWRAVRTVKWQDFGVSDVEN